MQKIKIAVLGILSVVAWVADWFYLNRMIYENQPLNYASLPALITVLAIAFTTFFLLTNRNRIISAVHNALIFFGYLFIVPKDVFVILGGAVFLIFLWLFEMRLLSEEKSRQDFSIRRTMGGSVNVIIYPLLLLIGLNVYYNTLVDFKDNQENYYNRLALTISKTAPYVTENFEGLSAEQKRQLTAEVTIKAVDQIKKSASAYQKYFPFLFALIVTVTLGTFAFILRWVTLIISWALFSILAATGFFKLETELVEVKKLIV